MDDPIFDPWSIGEAEEPSAPEPEASTSRERTTRWRSTSAGPPVPMTRPRPEPLTPPPADDLRQLVREVLHPPADAQPRPAEVRLRAPEGPASPPATPVASAETTAPLPNPQARILGDLLVPRLEMLAMSMDVARHQTTIDLRLSEDVPSIRFRLTPRPGGFDEPTLDASSVLEVRLDSALQEVSARLWLEPLSEKPAAQIAIPVSQFSGRWLDEVLLSFVERTLRRG